MVASDCFWITICNIKAKIVGKVLDNFYTRTCNCQLTMIFHFVENNKNNISEKTLTLKDEKRKKKKIKIPKNCSFINLT
jgi:hypothetical protein